MTVDCPNCGKTEIRITSNTRDYHAIMVCPACGKTLRNITSATDAVKKWYSTKPNRKSFVDDAYEKGFCDGVYAQKSSDIVPGKHRSSRYFQLPKDVE